MKRKLHLILILTIGIFNSAYAHLPDFHEENISKKKGIFFHSIFAPCASSTAPTESEIKKYLNAMNDNSQGEDSLLENATINGVEFHDESRFYLDLFEKLTTAQNDNLLSTFNREQEDIAKLVNNEDCKKVQCILEQIFPNVSLHYQYMLSRFGYNPSPFVFERAWNMNLRQAKLVLTELENLPVKLTKMHQNHRLTIGGFSLTNSELSYGNASIALFPNWVKASKYKQRQTIYHEVAHNIDSLNDTSISDQSEWLKISGWDEAKRTIINHDKMPSSYSTTNTTEHFAESILHYRYWPAKLHSDIFDYIRTNIFYNEEYTDNNNCFDATTETRRKLKEIEKKISFEFIPQEAFVKECSSSIRYSKNDNSAIKECLRGKYYFFQIQNDSIPTLVRNNFKDTMLDSSIEFRESEIAYITQHLRNKFLKDIDNDSRFKAIVAEGVQAIESKFIDEKSNWQQRVMNTRLAEIDIDSFDFESDSYKSFEKIIEDCSERLINDFINKRNDGVSCLEESLHDYYWNESNYKYILSYSGSFLIDDEYRKELSSEAENIIISKSKELAKISHQKILKDIESRIKQKIIKAHKISEWKKRKLYKNLSKEDFCKEYYSVNLNRFNGDSIEKSFLRACAKMQTKNKRFFLSTNNIDSILSEIRDSF
jgi:hypothetical protein